MKEYVLVNIPLADCGRWIRDRFKKLSKKNKGTITMISFVNCQIVCNEHFIHNHFFYNHEYLGEHITNTGMEHELFLRE